MYLKGIGEGEGKGDWVFWILLGDLSQRSLLTVLRVFGLLEVSI